MQDNVERLFSFVPKGSLSALAEAKVEVTLSGLDTVPQGWVQGVAGLLLDGGTSCTNAGRLGSH